MTEAAGLQLHSSIQQSFRLLTASRPVAHSVGVWEVP